MQDQSGSPEQAIERHGPIESDDRAAGGTRRHIRRWPAVALALAVIVTVLAFGWEARRQPGDQLGVVKQVQPEGRHLTTSPTVGKLAPNFLLKTTTGETVRLSDLRGRPVLLNFWATWCPYCVSEMPAMQQLSKKYGGKLEVVGVNAGEDPMKASSYAAEHGVHYTLALDTELEVVNAYHVAQMPASLFIDRQGIVRAVNYGPMTTAEMDKQIQPLLTS